LGSHSSTDEDRHKVVNLALTPAGELHIDASSERLGRHLARELMVEFVDQPINELRRLRSEQVDAVSIAPSASDHLPTMRRDLSGARLHDRILRGPQFASASMSVGSANRASAPGASFMTANLCAGLRGRARA
jgi:uncharacterized protein YjbI with pentapeptide repeats